MNTDHRSGRNGADEPHVFVLYVAGDSPNACRARQNLARLCAARLEGRHRIVIIDVLEEPLRALANRIIATPTLVKESPVPVRVLIGDLSNAEEVAALLDLPPEKQIARG